MTNTSSLTRLLVAAHRDGSTIAAPPVPEGIAAAMAIQNAVVQGLGRGIGGWKVAVNPEAGPVAAPMMDHVVLESPARWRFSPGIAIEVEVAVRLARDIPVGTSDRSAILAAIESMSLGIEVVLPRVVAGVPFPAYLADSLGNAGYVIDSKRMAWRDHDPATFALSVTSGGSSVFSGSCSFPLKDPLAPIIACATATNGTRVAYKAGEIVTTGSICGLVAVPGPGLLIAEVADFGRVETRFE
jgi:2-keto-4-pentenoate hydratase